MNQKLKDELEVFGWELLYSLYPLLVFMEEKNLSLKELMLILDEMFIETKLRLDSIVAMSKHSRNCVQKCPECGGFLSLGYIDIPQGKSNVYGYKSVLNCQNCIYEEYSILLPKDRIKQLNKEG